MELHWRWNEDEQYKMDELITKHGGLKNLSPSTQKAITLRKHFSVPEEKETGTTPTTQTQIKGVTNMTPEEVIRHNMRMKAREKRTK